MTAAHREMVERLFDGAVGLAPDAQREYLARNCPDTEVRKEVESLLAFAGTRLEGIPEAIEQVAGTLASPNFIGQRIGPYRLTGRIGLGGMGAVYRAVRADDQFQKTVAIKTLRFGEGDEAMLRRFRHERQILAALEHPYIARLLDGGAWVPPGSADSQPYIVMEYVEGIPLTVYCERNGLSLQDRLLLFRRVCDAVACAHRALVVHRDIKPANILVGSDGTPKLLDFGVAKLLDLDAEQAGGPLTKTGQFAMTPDYASPEQVRGGAVTTVTDVYALGAVLYELLTGARPHQLNGSNPVEIAQKICEEEVPAPSALGGKHLGGELDLIVLTALQKEPSRRYQSVEQLSEDIRRYIEELPILARPDTRLYRVAKFVQRNRLGVAAVLALFLAMAAGISVSAWEAVRANREAARARRAEQIAETVNNFLQNDLLASASANTQARPDNKPDPDLKVRTALDRAAAGIRGKFDRQLEVEAAIRETIGQTYMDLGLYPEARTQLERTLELHRRVLGVQNSGTLKTISRLGRMAFLQGKYPEAEALFRQSLEGQRRVLGPEHPDTLYSMNNLAGVYYSQGKYAQAEALHGQTLQIRRHVLGPEHPDTLKSMHNLALVYLYQAKYAQAEALYSQTLEIRRRVLGPEHPNTLGSMNNLANVYFSQAKYAQAEALHSQTLEIQRHVLGPEHPDTLSSMNNLAIVYDSQGKYAQAEALNRETLEIRRRVLGPEHPDTLGSMHNLAYVYTGEGKYAQAEALFRQTLEIKRRVLGPEHPSTLSSLSVFASTYQRQGKYKLAETQAAQALAGRRRALGSERPATMTAAADLALAYLSQGRFAESEPLAREALEFDRKKQADDWQRFRAESLLGASLAGQKKYTEAEPLLLDGYQGMLARKDRMEVPDWYHLDRAREWIIQLYRAWAKPDKTAEWRDKLQASQIPPAANSAGSPVQAPREITHRLR